MKIQKIQGFSPHSDESMIAQESAKKYWSDFGKEIEAGKFHRLFELLSELLSRLKRPMLNRLQLQLLSQSRKNWSVMM